MQGFRAAISHEAAFRQELILLVILVPVAFWLTTKPIHLMAMLGSLLLVLIIEMLNSALEAVVDRFGEELHLLSGRAKDMGSAAVFLAILNAMLIWGLVLYDLYFYS
jgi:diacylglycerol kinase (ATP)